MLLGVIRKRNGKTTLVGVIQEKLVDYPNCLHIVLHVVMPTKNKELLGVLPP